MTPRTTYTATCWREGNAWTVLIVQLDRTTRAARLADVDTAARRLIAAVLNADPGSIEVVVDLREIGRAHV